MPKCSHSAFALPPKADIRLDLPKRSANDPKRTVENKEIPANGEQLNMRDARQESFLKWASHSLIGHVVLFQIGVTFPMLFTFSDSMYLDGVLAFGRVLRVLFLTVGGGLVVAMLFWYTVSRPLIGRRKNSP